MRETRYQPRLHLTVGDGFRLGVGIAIMQTALGILLFMVMAAMGILLS